MVKVHNPAYLHEYDSPIGMLLLASDGERLCGLWLEGQKYFAHRLYERFGYKDARSLDDLTVIRDEEASAVPGIAAACRWLDVYFKGRDPGALPPVGLHGTSFQERVWRQLERIPYGRLTTYGDIGRALEQEAAGGRKVSSRAVGGAVGRNPVSIIVPCHRVVGASGSLTGYAGGIDRKIQILRLEGIDTDRLKVPMHGTAL